MMKAENRKERDVMRILVVEDELHLLDVLKKRLTKEHYSVDACSEGLEAMD